MIIKTSYCDKLFPMI